MADSSHWGAELNNLTCKCKWFGNAVLDVMFSAPAGLSKPWHGCLAVICYSVTWSEAAQLDLVSLM